MADKVQQSEAGSEQSHTALATADDNITTADLARGPAKAPAVADKGSPTHPAAPAASVNGNGQHENSPPLLSSEQAGGLRSNWDGIQASFVDEPRKAVTEADHLVADAIRRLAESFASERARLEHQWDRGEDVSTEDLRLALQHYRSFFQRLLSV